MNQTPSTPGSYPLDFEPTYRRVAQTNQWSSAIACIASVVNKPINEVRLVAARQSKRPGSGRILGHEKLIHDLFAHYDWWIDSRYREAKTLNALPDLALILMSEKPDHFGLFHRQKFEDGRLPVCYLINPALGIPVDQQWRLDVEAILPRQYLSICLMEEYMKDFW